MIAKPHIHCSNKQARKLGLKHGQKVSVKVIDNGAGKKSERDILFKEIIVRTDPSFNLHMHIDTDQANAVGLHGMGKGEIIKN